MFWKKSMWEKHYILCPMFNQFYSRASHGCRENGICNFSQLESLQWHYPPKAFEQPRIKCIANTTKYKWPLLRRTQCTNAWTRIARIRGVEKLEEYQIRLEFGISANHFAIKRFTSMLLYIAYIRNVEKFNILPVTLRIT